MEILSGNASEGLDSGKKETKGDKGSLDFPVVKIQLPKEAAIRVQAALQNLKERKADTKADELLAEYLDAMPESYLDDQIEKRTPEDYYFEAAKGMPELREKIIQQAKKALQRGEKSAYTAFPSGEPKKAKKREKSTHFAFPPDEGPEGLESAGGEIGLA